MGDPAKETVIIVHGTWAAPKPDKAQWYQPIDGGGAAEGFVSKLNTALQERISPAQCWAHCANGNPIFEWSGENDWIARTRAASALADYVAKLRNEGWRCHIVAHSHGGNVVVEALPQILAAPMSSESPSKIVTLGTPFIDTRAPMQKREKWATAFYRSIVWWSGIACMLVASVVLSAALAPDRFLLDFAEAFRISWIPIPIRIQIILLGALPLITSLTLFAYRRRVARTQPSHEEGAAWIQPQFLAIGSVMDEAWQILYHMRNVDDPLAVRVNLKSYLFSSVRSRMSRAVDIEHIRGAQPYRSLSSVKRWFLVLSNVISSLLLIILPMLVSWEFGFSIIWCWVFGFGFLLLVLVAMGLGGVVFHRDVLEGPFYSASGAPYRWFFRLIAALLSLHNEVLTYIVRGNAWRIMVVMAMGLEGYHLELPAIEQQRPSPVPTNFVKYEDMPKGAERNALNKRGAWVERHLKDISQTFSKLVLSAADMTALLRTIEEDQTLIHAAYYTDDECIARIADWIANTG
jgi:hypothetical protein